MSDSLYETDYYAWARQQAQALRDRAGPNALDIENLAEEVDDLAGNIRRACRSQIKNILEHLLKIQLVGSSSVNAWKVEVNAFRESLEDDLTPSLSAQLPGELAELYASVLRRLRIRWPLENLARPAARLTDESPYDWDDVIGREEGDWFPAAWSNYPE